MKQPRQCGRKYTIIHEEKATLRRRIKEMGTALTAAGRRSSDEALLSRFLSLPETVAAVSVMLYFGVGIEPASGELIGLFHAMGKTVALPRCLPGCEMEARVLAPGSALIEGAYGIPEPGEDCPRVSKHEIDLILVPALCYDRECYRLGRGKGYYDRFLEGYRGISVGLCRDVLLQGALPHSAFDRSVNIVVSETLRIEKNVKRGVGPALHHA